MKKRFLLIVPLFILAACEESPLQHSAETLNSGAILTSGHVIGISDAFHFLPPLAADPENPGEFDPSQEPVVEVLQWNGSSYESMEPRILFSMYSGSGSELIRMDESSEHYILNWHTRRFPLEINAYYSIEVSVSGRTLGSAQLAVIKSSRDRREIDTETYFPLIMGRTLPSKFRLDSCAPEIPEGLIGWWPFDEGAGIEASEVTGAGNHGQLVGATWTDGVCGSAVSFDGVDDYVTIPDNAGNLDNMPAITVSFWFNSREPLTGISRRRDFLYQACEGQRSSSWTVNHGDTPGTILSVFHGSNWFNNTYVFHPFTTNAAEWHLVTSTYDSQSGMKLFVDGQLAAEDKKIDTNYLFNSSTPLIVGARPGVGCRGFDSHFPGLIDELMIWGRALNPAEVASLYIQP